MYCNDRYTTNSVKISMKQGARCYLIQLLYWCVISTCAYTSTGKKYTLIHEMRLIKSVFFNAGLLRTAEKYAPISDMCLITCQYGNCL